MEDRCLSKFVIASVCVMAAAILMFILTYSVYTSNAFAQTDETNVGTNRTVNIQRTTSTGENVTGNDDLGNTPAQTNADRTVNIQRTTSTGENVTTDNDNAVVGNATALTNATEIGTTQTNADRTVNIQRTTSTGENVTTDNDNAVGNATALTNASVIGTNRTINIQRTMSTGENVTDNDDDVVVVGNALIMPSIIINNVRDVTIDKFAYIFVSDSESYHSKV